MSTLLFRTIDNRPVYEDAVATDAAGCLMGELCLGGRPKDLLDRLDYYAEGWPISTACWKDACNKYADLIVEYYGGHSAENCDAQECAERAELLATIRAWPIPARPLRRTLAA